MGQQMTLDFSRRITNGKRTERITVSSSEEFRTILDMVAERFGETRAELAFRYILEGLQRDIGKVFMAELHSDKPISEFLRG